MKKFIALILLIALSFTSLPLAYADFANGTLVQTESGFKPIEQIRVGDLVPAKDETTGKTEYHRVVQLFQRQADETYHITVKGTPITTTGEHPFWVHGQGWVEASHLKAGDLLQNAEGKSYPIDRIEMKNNSTPVYNFEVGGVHNYFVTESEIWTHNIGAIVRAIVKGVAKNAAKNAGKSAVKNAKNVTRGTGNVGRSSVKLKVDKALDPANSWAFKKINAEIARKKALGKTPAKTDGKNSGKSAGKASKGTGKVSSKSNYRGLYLDKNPGLPKGWQVHHTLPQKYVGIMKSAGINIHEVKYLRGVDPKVHSKITNEWTKWDKSLGRTPTAQEIRNFAKQIDQKYNKYWR
ncbi:polymorphic toxin-type HINT domain-containing protein [Paenibacillus popilliae]|nr:polymorphic toxin-type HINT domain-containing protein [Paenibacillus popilliae]